MLKAMSKRWLVPAIAAFTAVTMLSACGDSRSKIVEKELRLDTELASKQASTSLKTLETELKTGKVINANLIGKYADTLVARDASLKPIVDEIRKEATTNGPTFRGLQERLKQNNVQFKTVKGKVTDSSSDTEFQFAINNYTNTIKPEYDRIIGASLVSTYNEALSDYVNMLADMSGDTLPRVDGKKSSDFYKETGAKNAGGATMLVGNDNYGQWKQDSSGNSFWEFYGQYMFMSQLLDIGTGRYYYSDWHYNRPYSSYNDYYSSRYSHPKTYNRNASLQRKYVKAGSSKTTASGNYIKKNPTVTKKYQKMDNQFTAKRPGSSAMSGRKATGLKPSTPARSNKITGSSKWANQYSTSKPRSSGGSLRSSGGSTSRSSGRGK